jgi:micrococcal nuclease
MKGRKKYLKLFFISFLPTFVVSVFLASGREDRVFTTSTGSRYHREKCSSLRNSKIGITLEEAVRRGLKPCEICNPPARAPETGGTTVAADNSSVRSARTPSAGASSRDARSGALYRVNQQGVQTSGAADISKMILAKVTGHVDGDTVKVSIQNPPRGLNKTETIRMLGVDAPETRHPSKPVEYFGREASKFTRGTLFGKQVYLAFDWDLRDQYGRLLAYIYTGQGQCFNARLISEGYAHAYTRFTFKFMDEFRRFEQEARRTKRGLWNK